MGINYYPGNGSGGAAQTPWTADIDGNGFKLSDVSDVKANTLSLSSDSIPAIVWEPYVGGTTIQSGNGFVYIQGQNETALNGLSIGTSNIQLNSLGAGYVNIGTQGTEDLYLISGMGSAFIGPTGGGYQTSIWGNGNVSIVSGGGMTIQAYSIVINGAFTLPDYTTVGTYNEGEIAYNFSTHRPCFWDGTNWIDL